MLPSQVASLPASQVEEGVITSVYRQEPDCAAEDDKEGTVSFVLEEGSGYMEPSLHFLAIAHTVISFCCIIGYCCLKVQFELSLFCRFRIPMSFLTCKHEVYFKTTLRIRMC